MDKVVRIALCFLAIGPACAASFDCTKATSYPEKTVCADGELSSLDVSLARAYGDVLRERSDLLVEQRKWLKLRNACQERACLISAYQRRIIELSGMGAEAAEICGQVEQFIQEDGVISMRQRNDEQVLGELCGYTRETYEIKCTNLKHPFDIAQFRAMGVEPSEEKILTGYIDYGSGIDVSLVDINNDGFQDLHFQTSQGTLSCEKNAYLFGTADNKFRRTTGSIIESYMSGEDAGFCVGDGTLALKKGEVTYSVHLRADSAGLGAIYRGMADGSFIKLCQLGVKLKTEEVKRVVGKYFKVRHPDENTLLKKSAESIVGFQKPDKLAVLDELFSKHDMLQEKLSRHYPEHQFSKWVKGVSRELELVLLELNDRTDEAEKMRGQQQRLKPGSFKDLRGDKKYINLGVIDKNRFAIEAARQVSVPRQSPSSYMMALKFARPAILGDKALVYAESRELFSGDDSGELGSGYGISFKREKNEWVLIEMRQIWSGSTYPFGRSPE